MLKYLPFVVVGIVMVPLTVYQWSLMDWVWGANTPAMQCAYLLATGVPHEFGDWVGEDRPVDPQVLKVAGADGYIDRVYTNTKTNEKVSIWLIVGHFRQVSQHTPNFCYRAAGFDQVEKVGVVPIEVEDLPTSVFRTSKFEAVQGSQKVTQRVFWAWWKPERLEEGQTAEDIKIAWSAPEDPRVDFGYCRVLYKLYFTAGSTSDEKPEESVCLEFANEFLSIVNEAIRKSGVVMVDDELPENAEKVFAEMHQLNEKGDERAAKEEEEDSLEVEVETPADA